MYALLAEPGRPSHLHVARALAEGKAGQLIGGPVVADGQRGLCLPDVARDTLGQLRTTDSGQVGRRQIRALLCVSDARPSEMWAVYPEQLVQDVTRRRERYGCPEECGHGRSQVCGLCLGLDAGHDALAHQHCQGGPGLALAAAVLAARLGCTPSAAAMVPGDDPRTVLKMYPLDDLPELSIQLHLSVQYYIAISRLSRCAPADLAQVDPQQRAVAVRIKARDHGGQDIVRRLVSSLCLQPVRVGLAQCAWGQEAIPARGRKPQYLQARTPRRGQEMIGRQRAYLCEAVGEQIAPYEFRISAAQQSRPRGLGERGGLCGQGNHGAPGGQLRERWHTLHVVGTQATDDHDHNAPRQPWRPLHVRKRRRRNQGAVAHGGCEQLPRPQVAATGSRQKDDGQRRNARRALSLGR